jgi:hypothetical protein
MQHLQKTWGPLRKQKTGKRTNDKFLIHPFCFHALAHSFAQRQRPNSFAINMFRTLSIATGYTPLFFLVSRSKFHFSCRVEIPPRPEHLGDPVGEAAGFELSGRVAETQNGEIHFR